MKRLNIIVNGTTYDVVVEELKDGETIAPKAATAAAAPTPAQTEPTQTATVGAGTKVTSPMPGNIWKVLVKEGQRVKNGEVLFVLEAMKMENEIMAPCDGTVVSVHAKDGDTVDTDALIIVIA